MGQPFVVIVVTWFTLMNHLQTVSPSSRMKLIQTTELTTELQSSCLQRTLLQLACLQRTLLQSSCLQRTLIRLSCLQWTPCQSSHLHPLRVAYGQLVQDVLSNHLLGLGTSSLKKEGVMDCTL